MIRDSGVVTRIPKPERRSPTAALVVILALAPLSACSGAREHALLDQFFSASRLRDLTALHNVATVVYEPKEQGTVLSFDIISIAQTGEMETVHVSALVREPSGSLGRRNLRVNVERGLVTSFQTEF